MAITKEQKFDPNISAGWLPLCLEDALILDDHGNVVCPSEARFKGTRRYVSG